MSRPNLENLAYLLGVYSNSTIPQTYLNEMSDYELLLTVINKVNEIIERLGKYDEAINEVINYLNTLDDKVLKQVEDYLNNLNNNGYIANKITQIINSKKILMVGDSYLAGAGLPDPTTQGFGHLLYELGFNITALATPGGGFTAQGTNGRFLDVVRNWTENRESFTDVIFLGGINDSYTEIDNGTLGASIRDCIKETHQLYPNAKVSVGYISQTHRPQGNIKKVLQAIHTYKTGCIESNYAYINNSETMLKRVGLLQADGVHPTVEGHRRIANYLCSYLNNGNIATQDEMTGVRITGSPQFPNADPGDYYMLQTNNMMQVTLNQTSVWKANENAYPLIEMSGNTILHIGDFTQSLIYGQGEDLATATTNASFTVPATIIIWDSGEFKTSKSYPIALNLMFKGSSLFARPMMSDSNGANFWRSYIRQITVAPFTAVLNADIC